MKRALLLSSAFVILAGCASAPTAPRVSQAYGDLGKARLVFNNDPQGAVSDLTRAIEFDSRNAQLYVLRGMAFRKQGNQAAAEADFKQAIALDSGLKQALQPLMR
jgi:Flp pilus assembly protein TadD